MDEHDEILELARRVRQRLAWQASGGVDAVPRGRLPRRFRNAVQAPTSEIPSPPVSPLPTPATMEKQTAPGSPSVTDASTPSAARGAQGLKVIREELGDCQRCGLGRTRTNIVFGVGNPEAPLVFVGEGPGENEDLTGEPFVGKAGELLTRMIGAMGFSRDQIYICNVVKCRPPGNRNPLPDEITACEPFLIRQLGAIAPRVIVALGKFATQTLLRSDAPISALRGGWHRYQGIALMPTFHPAYLLRNPSSRREVWEDLKQVIAELDRLGIAHAPTGMKQG